MSERQKEVLTVFIVSGAVAQDSLFQYVQIAANLKEQVPPTKSPAFARAWMK